MITTTIAAGCRRDTPNKENKLQNHLPRKCLAKVSANPLDDLIA